MRKGIIMTLPQSDEVTEYLKVFSNPIIEACSKFGIKLKALKKNKATKEEFERNLKTLNYKMVVFNGHGDVNCITGHKNKEIIKVGDNEEILCDKITYARSCWAASGVGESCMRKNVSGCFIGYNIPFMFLHDATRGTNPLKDKIAGIFFETTNRVPIGIIKGQTSKQADENSKNSMLKAIKKSLIKEDKDSQAIAEILWNNYSGQVLIGNSGAML